MLFYLKILLFYLNIIFHFLNFHFLSLTCLAPFPFQLNFNFQQQKNIPFFINTNLLLSKQMYQMPRLETGNFLIHPCISAKINLILHSPAKMKTMRPKYVLVKLNTGLTREFQHNKNSPR